MNKSILFICTFLFGSISFLYSSEKCLTGNIEYAGNEWYTRATLSLKNTCPVDISLKNVKISLSSQDLNNSPVNLGTFINWWVNGSPYTIIFIENRKNLRLQEGVITAEKIDTPLIKSGQTIYLTGDIPLQGAEYDSFTAQKTLTIDGEIQKISENSLPDKPTQFPAPVVTLPKMLPIVIEDLGYTGTITYHVTFPFDKNHQQPQAEVLPIKAEYADLIMSNFVAGALLVHLINKHDPQIKFNRGYMIGTLFAQLLQENLDTGKYLPSTSWINPDSATRAMLLAVGQGGPYQINDYSKRLENNVGLINFVTLQKGLGYSVEDQDSGKQTASEGTATLDDKYFGPLAAAYFQYNDLLRLEAINEPEWAPSPDFKQCIEKTKTTRNNLFDMIMNATYNAGPWSSINTRLITLCANPETTKQETAAAQAFSLDDDTYNNEVKIEPPSSGTFILYPRQVRFYLDQLYGKNGSEISVPVKMQDLEIVFANCMATLGYKTRQGNYTFIPHKEAKNAFEQALDAEKLNLSTVLNISKNDLREQMFDVLERALDNLEINLATDFNEITEKTLL